MLEKWKQKEKWEFEFLELEPKRKKVPLSETGTTVKVWPLHPTIAESFSLETFRGRLATELAEAHIQSTANGLEIVFNGIALHHQHLVLFQSQRLKPAHRRLVFQEGTGRVNVRLYVNMANSDPSSAGWYVFCDESSSFSLQIRVSSQAGVETREETVPRYHDRFARVRGYAFFELPGRVPASLERDPERASTQGSASIPGYSPRSRQNLCAPPLTFSMRLDAEEGREVADDETFWKRRSVEKRRTKPDSERDLPTPPLPRSRAGCRQERAPNGPHSVCRAHWSGFGAPKKALKARTLSAVGERRRSIIFTRGSVRAECAASYERIHYGLRPDQERPTPRCLFRPSAASPNSERSIPTGTSVSDRPTSAILAFFIKRWAFEI